MEPSTAMFLLLPRILFQVLTLGAVGLFLFRVYGLWRRLRFDASQETFGGSGERLKSLGVYVFGQKRLFLDPYPGAIHVIIFWGFLVLSLGTLETFGHGLWPGFFLPVLGGSPVFALLLDLFSVAVLVAVGLAAYRRLVTKPARLTYSRSALIILSLIAALMLTQLLTEGFSLAAPGRTSYWWQPVGTALAHLLSPRLDANANGTLFGLFWWTHVLLLLSFLVYLPYSKHLHLIAAPFNVFLRDLGPKGAMTPVDLAERESVGATDMWGFSWKDRLDLFSCTECGRCQEQCPAHLSGKPLSPKMLINDLKHHLLATDPSGRALPRSDGGLVGTIIPDSAVWSCTTCRACQEVCPVLTAPMSKVLELRRGSVLMGGQFPAEMRPALQSLENQANPWGMWYGARGDALETLKVKRLSKDDPCSTLLFVGCTGAFDDRIKKVTASLVRLLKMAEVDFGVLGVEEKCCGDPARRIGEEYLFQELAKRNIETFGRYGVTRIATACPHCFNVMKNEYPQLGGRFEVLHHSQLLMQLVEQGKLKPARELGRKLTYHDPCYLGRHNSTYDAPRAAIAAIPGASLLEMGRSRENSFCCGGGGGRMWMAERTGQRINQMRVEEAMGVQAETIATACPFCLIMMEDGVSEKGMDGRIQVRDLAELIEWTI